MKNKFLPILLIVIIWFAFSFPFFVHGKVAFPSTFQVNFFPPWSAYKELSGPVKNNAQPDIITQLYPWRYFDIQQMKMGRLALWNPYSFGGTPHLANYQSAVLFPLNILFFLPFSFSLVWSFLVVAQPLLAGIGMYILARKNLISKAGSLLGAFSFMFCGFLVTWMGYATLGYAILPLPYALFAIDQYATDKQYKWLFFLSFTFLFSFFSGHFQTSIYFSFAVFAFIFYNITFSKEKLLFIESFLFAIFGLFLSMPQILPSIELYSQSVRSSLFQKVEAIPLSYLPTLLAPDFYGNPVTRNDWFGHYAEWNGYSGGISLVIAFFALLRKNLRVYFFIFLAVVSLLLAYDTPVLSLLVFLKIPVLSTSSASRIIVLFSFSVAMLSGFGLDGFMSCLTKNKKTIVFWMAAIFVIIATLGVVTITHTLPSLESTIARKNFVLPAVFLMLLVVGAIILLFKTGKKYRTLFLVLVLVLGGFEMYRFAQKWQPFDPENLVFRNVPITNFYLKGYGADRFYGEFTAEDAVYFNLPTITGYDPLYPARFGEFIKAIQTGIITKPDRSVVQFPKFGKYTPLLINFLGIKYFSHKVSDAQASWEFPYNKYPLSQFTKIYDDSRYQIFRNNTINDRSFVVSSISVKNDKQEIIDTMFTSNLQQEAVTEEKIDDLDAGATGTAKILEYRPDKVSIQAESSGKALLILTDNFYPGWKATVNGDAAKIYRADYTFRGVVIPKGKSIVTFTYLPMSFLVGIYLFFIGVLGIVTSIIFKYFQKK